jgi:site-specific DNA-methyltransferase (adenine-specific)
MEPIQDDRPTPYYSDEWVTLYHGDCRAVLPFVSADAVVTDPPYNLGIEYGVGTDDRRSDYALWCRSWFDAISAPTVAIAVGMVNQGLWFGIREPDWIIAWVKPAAMGRSPLGYNNWEPVFVYGKAQGRHSTDVLTAGIVPDGAVAGHPCPKPLKWGTGLVERMSLPGQTVLDPFAGSGTTLRAAKDLGRRSIGIEIEERYCEIAANRLAQEVLAL